RYKSYPSHCAPFRLFAIIQIQVIARAIRSAPPYQYQNEKMDHPVRSFLWRDTQGATWKVLRLGWRTSTLVSNLAVPRVEFPSNCDGYGWPARLSNSYSSHGAFFL